MNGRYDMWREDAEPAWKLEPTSEWEATFPGQRYPGDIGARYPTGRSRRTPTATGRAGVHSLDQFPDRDLDARFLDELDVRRPPDAEEQSEPSDSRARHGVREPGRFLDGREPEQPPRTERLRLVRSEPAPPPGPERYDSRWLDRPDDDDRAASVGDRDDWSPAARHGPAPSRPAPVDMPDDAGLSGRVAGWNRPAWRPDPPASPRESTPPVRGITPAARDVTPAARDTASTAPVRDITPTPDRGGWAPVNPGRPVDSVPPTRRSNVDQPRPAPARRDPDVPAARRRAASPAPERTHPPGGQDQAGPPASVDKVTAHGHDKPVPAPALSTGWEHRPAPLLPNPQPRPAPVGGPPDRPKADDPAERPRRETTTRTTGDDRPDGRSRPPIPGAPAAALRLDFPAPPVSGPPAAAPASGPPTTVPASGPPTTVPASGPPTTVPASGPPTTVPASEPPTTVPASEPPTTVAGPPDRPVSGPPAAGQPAAAPARPTTESEAPGTPDPAPDAADSAPDAAEPTPEAPTGPGPSADGPAGTATGPAVAGADPDPTATDPNRTGPGAPADAASHDTVLPAPDGRATGAAAAIRTPTMLTPVVEPRSADDTSADPSPTAPVDPERVLAAYKWRFHSETLRELVEDPAELRTVRDGLTGRLESATDNRSRARLLSLRAVVSRILGDLGKALADGRLALTYAETTGELRRIAIAQARLAHVLQWRGEFAEADRLFAEANSSELPDRLRATMHEHAGRSCYDQGRYIEACNHFEKALDLRRVEDPDLIARTELALDAVFAKVAQNGWGPYARTRDEVLQVHRPPTPVFDDRVRRWGFDGPAGERVIAPSYAEVQPFAEGTAWVRRPEIRTWELIDESGELLIPATAGYRAVGSFSDGLAWVSADGDGSWRAIDRTNEVVIPARFDDVRPFRRGIAAVAAIRNGGWGAVDRTGRVVVPMRYTGFATALTDGRYVDGFSDEGLAIVDADGRRGVVNRDGRVIVPPRYPALVIHPVAFLVGTGAGRWGALDRRGEPLVDPVHPSRAAVTEEIDRLLADTEPVL
ncbi:WG repeat-containing protein [Plantactinospora sp. GCM10030261]|uniref:WG repeat-containing protein n=1 Tax=Plantactinospora sp. GCM10030261 TaxID=3273420 RepID=UPI00360C079B